jgi:hypothetical protein
LPESITVNTQRLPCSAKYEALAKEISTALHDLAARAQLRATMGATGSSAPAYFATLPHIYISIVDYGYANSDFEGLKEARSFFFCVSQTKRKKKKKQ